MKLCLVHDKKECIWTWNLRFGASLERNHSGEAHYTSIRQLDSSRLEWVFNSPERIVNLFSRPLQKEVILAAIEGHDVFLQAATSFGKSLCFQLPAVVSHGGTGGDFSISWL
jgi:hypothetical protein